MPDESTGEHTPDLSDFQRELAELVQRYLTQKAHTDDIREQLNDVAARISKLLLEPPRTPLPQKPDSVEQNLT